MADGDRVRILGPVAEGQSVGDSSPIQLGLKDPEGKVIKARSAEDGALKVDTTSERLLLERLSIQGTDAALLGLLTRGHERITLTDRRGSDGQRGR